MSKDLSSYHLPAFWRDASVVWYSLTAAWYGKPGPQVDLRLLEAAASARFLSPFDEQDARNLLHEDIDIRLATLCWEEAIMEEEPPATAPILRRLIDAYGSASAVRSVALQFIDARLAEADVDPAYLAQFFIERKAFADEIAVSRDARQVDNQVMNARSALPTDFWPLPSNAADVMVMLRDQLGFSLRDIIDLDLQALHDLFTVNAEDTDEAERLVIVDDDTIELLDEVVTDEIAKARPDRRIKEDGYEGWTSRSRATERLGGAAGMSIADLEAQLSNATQCDEVVLEDDDYRRVMAALNETISSRPHGRAWSDEDGAVRANALATARAFTIKQLVTRAAPPTPVAAPGFDVEASQVFVAATEIALRRYDDPEGNANGRSAAFGSALAGEENTLLPVAEADQRDIVCLGFAPGREQEGPTNITIYEFRQGRINAWLECDPVMTADSSTFGLRSRDGGACFSLYRGSLVPVADRVKGDVVAGVARGRAIIVEIAATLINRPPEKFDT